MILMLMMHGKQLGIISVEKVIVRSNVFGAKKYIFHCMLFKDTIGNLQTSIGNLHTSIGNLHNSIDKE